MQGAISGILGAGSFLLTVTMELPPEIEASVLAKAQAEGIPLTQ